MIIRLFLSLEKMRNILMMQVFLSLGNALVGIFYPFLVMDTFHLSFSQILCVIGIEYGLMGLFVYPLQKISFLRITHKISLGIIFLFSSLLALSMVPEISGSLFLPENFFMLAGLVLLASLSLTFLWPAFHWVSISLVDEKSRGKFLGNIQAIIMGSLLLGPFISGYIIDWGYANYVLWTAGFFYFLCLVSAFFIPIEKSPQLKSFPEIVVFFRQKTLENSFSQMSVVEAVQTSSLLLVYPILLKISLKSYGLMGTMFFVMAIVEMLSAKIVGFVTDKYSSKKVMKWGALARFLDIAPRGLLAFFPSSVFAGILSVSAGILGPLFGVSFYAQMYARAESSGDMYSFLVTREWILGLARFLFFTLTALAYSLFGIYSLAFALFLAGFLSFFLKKM